MKASNFGALQGSYCKRNVQLRGDSFVPQFGKWETGDKETYSSLLLDSARVTAVLSMSRIYQICWESSPCNISDYSAQCPCQLDLPVQATLFFLCLWSMRQGPSTSTVSSCAVPSTAGPQNTAVCMGLQGTSWFHLYETQSQQDLRVGAGSSWDNAALAGKLINCLIISWVI